MLRSSPPSLRRAGRADVRRQDRDFRAGERLLELNDGRFLPVLGFGDAQYQGAATA